MKYIKFAIEIFLDDVGYFSAIHFLSRWNNNYILYFEKDDIDKKPIKILSVDKSEEVNIFEYKLLKREIMSVANECIKFIRE